MANRVLITKNHPAQTVTITKELFEEILAVLERHDHCQNLDEYYPECLDCHSSGRHRPSCDWARIFAEPEVVALRGEKHE
jgi:hypothetical protein